VWKMIYGDWESRNEQLSVLLNAMKAVNPSMHYEYIPKPNAWIDGRQIFFHVFWCFPQCVDAFSHCCPVFSIDGTFLLGKYQGVTPRILELIFFYFLNSPNSGVTLSFFLFSSLSLDLFQSYSEIRLEISCKAKTLRILSFVCCTMPNHAFVLIE
jgi:hypothetical protein